MEDEAPKLRGFAKLTPERRRDIASKGGSSVEPQERAFSRNPDLAARAGPLGGERLKRTSTQREPSGPQPPKPEGSAISSAED